MKTSAEMMLELGSLIGFGFEFVTVEVEVEVDVDVDVEEGEDEREERKASSGSEESRVVLKGGMWRTLYCGGGKMVV